MDVATNLKSLLLAVRQYRDSRTTQHAAQLQKQVKEVSSLRCDQLLSSSQLLPADCVSGLVELVGSPNTDPALLSAIITLLVQLASSDESREILHSSYNLTAAVASVIHCHSTTPGEPLVLQCLQVLQKLTYNTRIFHTSNHIRQLLDFLVSTVQSQSDEIIMPCLGLLANLCRDNHSVQSYIKSLDSVKPFYRTLITFLAHNSLTVVVFALSILASLTLNEKVGEKLFDAKNIHQTFQLVFNIIVNGNGTLTRNYSVDLLVDLMKNPKIADYLTRYEYFSACVSQVLGLLQSKDPDSAAKVLELLLAMCGVPGLRPLLCQVLFKPAPLPALKLRGAVRRQGAGPESGLALMQWLSSPVEGAERCSLQVLQLLEELLQESLAADGGADGLMSFLEVLLPKVLELLEAVDAAEGDVRLRRRCGRITHAASLLLVLCADDSARTLLSCQLTAQLCLSLVQSLLSCCHGHAPLSKVPAGSDSNLSQLLAEALLKSLELMSKLRPQVNDMETSFYRVLQDQRIVTPLSLALTSHRRERVQTGLSLLFEATPLPDFPSLVLGDSIAANNAYHQREAELSVKRLAVQEVPPTSFLDSSSGVSSCHSVHSLAEKIQGGLELQDCVKDPRMSDIIDIYEQKLSAFACKESGLQDLLEAKALALSQSDRLLAQYRVQRAQAEAEASKLGALLKEAERRCEQQGAELSTQVLEVQRSRADMEELLQHNSRLQKDSEEHQVLRGAYNALLNRSAESERQLKELQAAHTSLSKHNDSLRREHQALQQQNDKTAATLQEREEELDSLRSELQRRNSELTGVRAELRAEEEKVAAREQEQRELEESLDVVRTELSRTEQARKDASIKASSLELQKVQLEAKLKQKEDELNKHSAMISMIHSLSSGKMKCDVNLSL